MKSTPVEHAGASRRDRCDVLGAETSTETGAACFDSRPGTLHHDGFGKAGELQHDRSFQGRAGADHDVGFVQRRKPRHHDVQQVHSRRQGREQQLPFLIRRHCRQPSDQRRRFKPNECTWKNATLVIFHRPDESTGQALCGSDAMSQHKSHKDR
jgi:hypothetical protein